jgi:hypothetical protein
MTPSQNITLDMGRRSESRHVVYLGQGDSNGTVLMVSLTEDGRPYDASGMTAVMTIPIDGNAVSFDGEVTGTTARFAIDESLLGDVNGRFRGAYVTLSGDGFTSSSQRFDVDVLQSFADDGGGEGEGTGGEPGDEPEEPTAPATFITDDELDNMFGE